MIKGAEKPEIQGWYSRKYNIKKPNYCAEFESPVDKEATFAWIIKTSPDGIVDEIDEIKTITKDIGRMELEIPHKEDIYKVTFKQNLSNFVHKNGDSEMKTKMIISKNNREIQ